MANAVAEERLLIAAVPPEQQVSWRGVFPGRTSESDMLALLGKPASMERGEGGTIYCYPPGSHCGETAVNLVFDRVVRVVLTKAGIVDHVHIGGFFPSSRPTLDQIQAVIQKGLEQVPGKCKQQKNARVLDAPDAGLWVIASSVPDGAGQRQVLAMHFYRPSERPELPVTEKPYLK